MNDSFCEFSNSKQTDLSGLQIKHKGKFDTIITETNITTKSQSALLKKGIGNYITIYCKKFNCYDNTPYRYIAEQLTDRLKKIITSLNLPDNYVTLVVGLGNYQVVADSLGVEVVNKIIVTKAYSETHNNSVFKKVCTISPSVMSKTGIDTAVIVKSLCNKIKPDLVVLVDSMGCKDVDYLGHTFQLSNVGVIPGGKVNKNNKAITKSLLKIPVISIGCPLVCSIKNLNPNYVGYDELFTTKDIDALIDKCSYIIALAINRVLQSKLSYDDVDFFMS